MGVGGSFRKLVEVLLVSSSYNRWYASVFVGQSKMPRWKT